MWWINSFNSRTTALQTPISVDNVHFTAAAFSTSGATITINSNANCDSMIWDNTILAANAPTLSAAGNIVLDIYGSLLMTQNMTFDFIGYIWFRSTRPLEGILSQNHKLSKRTIAVRLKIKYVY